MTKQFAQMPRGQLQYNIGKLSVVEFIFFVPPLKILFLRLNAI
jgi:hypothetical protein